VGGGGSCGSGGNAGCVVGVGESFGVVWTLDVGRIGAAGLGEGLGGVEVLVGIGTDVGTGVAVGRGGVGLGACDWKSRSALT